MKTKQTRSGVLATFPEGGVFLLWVGVELLLATVAALNGRGLFFFPGGLGEPTTPL